MRAWIFQTLFPLSATALVLSGVLYLGDCAEQCLQANEASVARVEVTKKPMELQSPTVRIEKTTEAIQPVKAEEIVSAAAPIVALEESPTLSPIQVEQRVIGTLLPYKGEVPVLSLEFRRSDLPK